MPKNLCSVGPLLLAFLLSACSSKPTDADLKTATIKSLEDIGGKGSAKAWQKEIDTMRVLSCKTDDKAYVCDVQGIMGPEVVRMIKEDDGWIVIQQKQ